MKRKALRVRSEGSIPPYVTEAESRKQHSDSPLCNSLHRGIFVIFASYLGVALERTSIDQRQYPMYRVNVSLFIKAQEYQLLDKFLRTTLVPQLRGDEGVAQVDLLEVMAQAPVMDMAQPMDDMVLALLISLEQEQDVELYLSEVLGERLELLGKTFGERVLYHVTPMRQIAL